MLRYGEQCGFSPSWAEPTLVYAAESGNALAIDPFIYEFDINHRIDGNQTALMISATHGRFDAVLSLIFSGADSTLRDNDKHTAADLAADAGHEVVASLLKHHSSSDWESIKDTAATIRQLLEDSAYSKKLFVYESLLETKKFGSLRFQRIDYTLLPEDELIWFRAAENCSIGIDDSRSLIWKFNELRPPR